MEKNISFMKNKILFLLPLLFTTIGCSNNESTPTGEDKTIIDTQGREVTYNTGKLNRVICIGAGALRYYSYIGDINKIVAVEEIDSKNTFGVGQALRPYYQANVDYFSSLPLCGKGGPMAQVADVEAIVRNNPDIIISFLSSEANNDLESNIDVPVIGLSQGKDGIFDDKTLSSLKLLSTIFNRNERYESIKNLVETAKNDFKDLTLTEDSYYVGCIGNWGKTNLLGSFNEFPVFKYAKVKNALSDLDVEISGQQVSIESEALVKINPDHIFVDTSGLNEFINAYKLDSTIYDSLKAFEDGETYQLLPYNAYYTNLEIQLMSTYYVAQIAHEEFEYLNLEEKMNEITNVFLNKEMYNEMKSHQYGFGGYRAFDIKEYIS